MTKEIHSEIRIQATPERVWKVLADFDHYPDWNPFIRYLKGNVAVGNPIRVAIKPVGAKQMEFRPTVQTLEPERAFSWLGKLLHPAIFTGLHEFELRDNRDGTTTFRQSEKFKGLMVLLFNPGKTQKGFEAMNEKLKELVESSMPGS